MLPATTIHGLSRLLYTTKQNLVNLNQIVIDDDVKKYQLNKSTLGAN